MAVIPSISSQNVFGDNLIWDLNFTTISEDAVIFGTNFIDFLQVQLRVIELGGVPSRKYINVYDRQSHIKSLANIVDEKL